MSQEDDEHEEREVEYEHHFSREEVAEYLRTITEGLEGGEMITISIGDDSVEFTPPEYFGFEVEYEEAGDEREVEFELEWTVREEDLEISSG